MRTRAAVLALVLALPVSASAQRIPIPRIGRRPTPQPAALPPEAPEVARALALQRSRWSTEAYGLLNTLQMPSSNGGGMVSYTTFGTGTHADYRYTDHTSATLDMTLSAIGSPAIAGTFEAGSRYAPLPFDSDIRPYFDARLGYTYLYDTYSQPYYGTSATATPLYEDVGRYSRGFGALAGVGYEYTLTNSFSLTNEFSAERNRMTIFRLNGAGSVPYGTRFYSTTFRISFGLKYNRTRSVLAMQQKAR